MQHFSTISSVWALKPFAIGFGFAEPPEGQPRRKHLPPPIDRGLFVKPIKQSFIRNPRLSPMTRVMLTLLAGWSGHGGPIETTLGILGRHLGRSSRQVQRYLRDAIEEGFVKLSYTKDRIGRITGIRLVINRQAILHSDKRRAHESSQHSAVTSPKLPTVASSCRAGTADVDDRLRASFARPYTANRPRPRVPT